METTIQIREVNISYGKKKTVKQDGFRSPENVSRFLRKIAPNNSQEHFIAVFLDGNHSPIGYSIVCTGTANMCPIHPREIFQRAIVLGSVAVIIAHNHPSGHCEPSSEDREVTRKLKECGRILDVKILDHVIFSDSDFYSFNDQGLL